MNKTNTPQIRFKGFTEAWEQRKLSELGKVLTGNTPPTSERENWAKDENGYVWITPTDINALRMSDSERHLTAVGWGKARYVPSNSVLITSIASIGKNAINTVPAAFNQQINAIIPIENSAYFILTAMENEKARFAGLAGKTATAIINKTEFEKFSFFIPKLQEQERISGFFENLDNLITLHQRKCEMLQKTKKALLEKMFPQNGSAFPEVRFKGFTEAWEQRKVGNICSISTGKSNTQDKVDDGIYPFYVRSPIVEHSNKYLYDEEAVLTVGDGVGTGKVFHYVNGKYDLHQRVYRMFGFSEDVSAKFFYDWFSEHFYKRVMAMTAKTSVDSVRYEMIADMDIQLPSLPEQKAIADFFFSLDNLITLHQRELEKLQKLKSACLQKMFV